MLLNVREFGYVLFASRFLGWSTLGPFYSLLVLVGAWFILFLCQPRHELRDDRLVASTALLFVLCHLLVVLLDDRILHVILETAVMLPVQEWLEMLV